jgi:hypothetical protein
VKKTIGRNVSGAEFLVRSLSSSTQRPTVEATFRFTTAPNTYYFDYGVATLRGATKPADW